MARIVREGQPGKLLRLRPADVRDPDLRFSYLRYVDLSGQDLSALDLRAVDILDSNAEGCRLPEGQKLRYMVSRRTSWRNAVLPPNTPTYNHDLNRELLRQLIQVALQQTRSEDFRRLAQALLDRAQTMERTEYSLSIPNAVYFALQYIDAATLRAWALEVFAPCPTLLKRVLYHLDKGHAREAPPDIITPLSSLEVRGLGSVDVSSAVAAGTLDRWQAARDIEAYLLGLGHDCYVYVAQLDPQPVVFAVTKASFVPDDWDWWHRWWRE